MPQFFYPLQIGLATDLRDFPGPRPVEKEDNQNPNTMPDILYILASIGFFVLMIAFIWACEKV